MPEISIISPVKNASLWLSECIESVQAQSHTNWEWILVDDHSSDSSLEILTAYALEDSRIKVFRAESHGIIPALNQAFTHCSGDFLCRMDADDVMPKDRLRLLHQEALRSSPNTVLTGRVNYFSSKPVSDGYLKYQDWLNQNLFSENPWASVYRECIIASPNWMVRRSEMEKIGAFRDLQYPEDYDLCFKWYAHKWLLKAIPETTLYWREHPNRTSRNSAHYDQEAFFQLKLRRFVALDHKASHELCVWGTGRKAETTLKTLRDLDISYTQMHFRDEDRKENSIGYKALENFTKVQLLIAVYPPPSELEKIRNYLTKLKLREGKNYWFL